MAALALKSLHLLSLCSARKAVKPEVLRSHRRTRISLSQWAVDGFEFQRRLRAYPALRACYELSGELSVAMVTKVNGEVLDVNGCHARSNSSVLFDELKHNVEVFHILSARRQFRHGVE